MEGKGIKRGRKGWGKERWGKRKGQASRYANTSHSRARIPNDAAKSKTGLVAFQATYN